MVARVRCDLCGELLYDPLAREHFLEEDTDGVNHCPGCGAKYHLIRIVKQGDEPEEEDE